MVQRDLVKCMKGKKEKNMKKQPGLINIVSMISEIDDVRVDVRVSSRGGEPDQLVLTWGLEIGKCDCCCFKAWRRHQKNTDNKVS